MRIAIIGANGFIGTRLTEIFHLGDRHAVVPIVRRAAGLALPGRFAVPWRIADALDVAALAHALGGCDAVVHSALGDPRQIERMPAVLCAAAAAAKVSRVVYLSSASVHGQAPAPGTTEDSPLRTSQAMEYNNAKVRAERAFFRGCARHRLTGFALRPGVVFGPRSRWISDLAHDLRLRQAWLLNEGRGVCNTLYVDNLAEAIKRCVVAPADAAGAYLVGDAERITWAKFYERVAVGLDIPSTSIHRLKAIPTFTRSAADQLAGLRASAPVQALLPAIPGAAKRFARRALAALCPASPAPDSWRLPDRPQPRVTQELTLLQQCEWLLPSDRAALRLGYRPVVDFATGMQRSLAWLAFAEGRT